jgi:hypothetical protein
MARSAPPRPQIRRSRRCGSKTTPALLSVVFVQQSTPRHQRFPEPEKASSSVIAKPRRLLYVAHYSLSVNFQAHHHSSGCGSGGHPTHSV